MITNQEAWAIYEKYLQAWKQISDEQRIALAIDILAEDAQYASPTLQAGGRNSMIDSMSAFEKQFPCGHVEVVDVFAHHDDSRWTWILVQADGTVFAKGHDQMRVSSAGKIVSMTTFSPPVSKP